MTTDGDEARVANTESTAHLRTAADLEPHEVTDEQREQGLAQVRQLRSRRGA